MAKIVILIFLCVFIKTIAIGGTVDTLHCSFNMSNYKVIAINKYFGNIQCKSTDSILAKNQFPNLVCIGSISLLSIPVLNFNDQVRNFNCTENIEEFLDFKEEPNFQNVAFYNNGVYFGGLLVIDSYKKSIEDRCRKNNEPIIYGNPVCYDIKTEKMLLRYSKKNPEAFIFMIKWIDGFWAIKNGKLFKITHSHDKPIDKVYHKCFSKDYIKDAYLDAIKIGYPYILCPKMTKNENKIIIKMEIK